MKQDIVAAAWHAELGANPDTNPSVALDAGKATWVGREPELIELVRRQAGIPKPIVSLLTVEDLRTLQPTPSDLAELERQFHYGQHTRNIDD